MAEGECVCEKATHRVEIVCVRKQPRHTRAVPHRFEFNLISIQHVAFHSNSNLSERPPIQLI